MTKKTPRGGVKWTPAETFTVTKLPSRGPKPGQSVEAYLRGKKRQHAEFVAKGVKEGKMMHRNDGKKLIDGSDFS